MIQIAGSQLNQWDVGRSVSVSDSKAAHVHFANQGDSKAVIIEITDGTAKIPNYLLQTGKPLLAYAVLDGVTLECKSFAVHKRERPENYVYEDDHRNYIYELITDAEAAVANANQAAQKANEAAEKLGSTVIPTKVSQLENDSGFLTDAPVTSVNGQTGDVQIPTAMKVTVTQGSEGSYYTDTDVDIIQEALEENRTVVCYWSNENIMLHLVTYIPNGHYVFTAIEGAKEYCVVIRDTEDVYCTVTKLSQGAAPQEAILYTPQALTHEQQSQARQNIAAIEAPETAEVGQTIVVKEVDENGKPTAWEAANFPAGGNSVSQNFSTVLTSDAAYRMITVPLPVNLGKALIFNVHVTFPSVETEFILVGSFGKQATRLATIPVNSKDVGLNLYAVRHTENFYNSGVTTAKDYTYLATPALSNAGWLDVIRMDNTISIYPNTDGVDLPAGTKIEVWGICE